MTSITVIKIIYTRKPNLSKILMKYWILTKVTMMRNVWIVITVNSLNFDGRDTSDVA